MSKKNSTQFNFEDALANLNVIVDEMESGNLSLEDALKKFETGIKLTRECQKTLKNAEQKVQILMKENGSEKLNDYEGQKE